MQRAAKLGAAVLIIAGMLAGCIDERQGDIGNRNIRQQQYKKDANGNWVIDKRFAVDQMNDMNRANGGRLNNNNLIGAHKNYRMEMNSDVSREVASIQGLRMAYVLLADENVYVAVATNEPGAEPDQSAKQEVARKVKELHPSRDLVYVSADPVFVDRMAMYMHEAQLGRSVQPYIAEFNAMVDRIFPIEAGIR
ncbi:YhcN/YlaJ family sporulation lipoprotein [Paenibacillus sp. 1P07SE]|uniref:YhcN/YlaJ family sporulation lipoprotein n=1 Tax=Paenibacillus sp. 1P07SE TaxID=3132209 RepID=UPI0039A406C8